MRNFFGKLVFAQKRWHFHHLYNNYWVDFIYFKNVWNQTFLYSAVASAATFSRSGNIICWCILSFSSALQHRLSPGGGCGCVGGCTPQPVGADRSPVSGCTVLQWQCTDCQAPPVSECPGTAPGWSLAHWLESYCWSSQVIMKYNEVQTCVECRLYDNQWKAPVHAGKVKAALNRGWCTALRCTKLYWDALHVAALCLAAPHWAELRCTANPPNPTLPWVGYPFNNLKGFVFIVFLTYNFKRKKSFTNTNLLNKLIYKNLVLNSNI